MSAPEDALIEIIDAHRFTKVFRTVDLLFTGRWECSCGGWIAGDGNHSDHLAAVIQAEYVAEREAQAWDACAQYAEQWAADVEVIHPQRANPYRTNQEADPGARYLDRLERSRPRPEVQAVIDRLRQENPDE